MKEECFPDACGHATGAALLKAERGHGRTVLGMQIRKKRTYAFKSALTTLTASHNVQRL